MRSKRLNRIRAVFNIFADIAVSLPVSVLILSPLDDTNLDLIDEHGQLLLAKYSFLERRGNILKTR